MLILVTGQKMKNVKMFLTGGSVESLMKNGTLIHSDNYDLILKIMNKTHYKLGLTTMGKGLVIFLKSWGVTLDRLLHDTLRGIRHHWFFALVLTTLFVTMFVVMDQSSAMYHHSCMVNYQLSQSLDSVKLLVEK